MKYLFFLAIIFPLTFISCSKKGETNPQSTQIPQITINGRAYATVIIGNQTWTAENYQGDGGVAVSNASVTFYGKLYKWSEAQAITLPSGWRIPTQNDFEALLKSQGTVTCNYDSSSCFLDTASALHLRSRANWTLSGDNLSGFNGEPAGDYNYFLNQFENTYAYATFWGSTFKTHGINPGSQTILNLIGYYSSYGTGHTPQSGAFFDAFEAGGEVSYSLRFVKDN